MADRDLANYDSELAARVQIIPGMDARLACIDTDACADNYHVLQGIKEPDAESVTSKCCYLYQRFGGTGTRGTIDVQGPMEQPKVARLFSQIFQDKTGAEWGSVKPGDRGKPGKFWLQQQGTPDLKARWEYFVSDGVDGKPTGWYPYSASASDEVEELYSQHVANARESRTATRVVRSDYFAYLVDLDKMKQTNQRTKKARHIRRVGEEVDNACGRPSAAAAMKPVTKARRGPAFATATKVRAAIRAWKAAAAVGKLMKVMRVARRPGQMAMKPKKAAKRNSKVGSRRQVFCSKKEKTKSGMKKDDLMKSKSGKIVSKRKSANGLKSYEKNIAGWVAACVKARKELGLSGFVAVKKGTAFYDKSRELYISAR